MKDINIAKSGIMIYLVFVIFVISILFGIHKIIESKNLDVQQNSKTVVQKDSTNKDLKIYMYPDGSISLFPLSTKGQIGF